MAPTKIFDALIILGYPSSNIEPDAILKSRLDKGIELFAKGKAKYIILSGSAVHSGHVEAEIMAAYCIRMGIPEDVIILEKKARNTYENAFYTKKIMQELHFKKIIVITSSFHKPRAKFIFDILIPNTSFSTAAFPKEQSTIKHLYLLLRERLLLLYYRIIGDKRLKKAKGQYPRKHIVA